VIIKNILQYISTNSNIISPNVPVIYDVFVVAIKECVAFQQPQKCAGVRRGNVMT